MARIDKKLTIEVWLKKARAVIPALDAEVIAVKAFAPKQADRSWLIAHDEQEIDGRARQKADAMLRKRAHGMPLAYVIGEKEFYGRKFAVCPGVLIPRPETESLIELIKALDLPERPRFMEIGTGSGCIAITLALEYPQAYVLATDLGVRALDIAVHNDVVHEGRIDLVQSNLLEDLGFDDQTEYYNVLVANLPYVDKSWDWLDLEALSYEPASALYARGNNGLSLYQRLLRQISYHQRAEHILLDYLVLEADPCQHRALITMAEKAGFLHVRTEGYGLIFESVWRYWWDYKNNKYIHKPDVVIKTELKTGVFSVVEDEL